jgi:hypothetical protein
LRRRQAGSCKRQTANSRQHTREARGKRHAASSTHAASGMQPAAHLVLSFLLIGPAASFLVAVMVHSLPTGRFQIFSQDNVRTAVLAGGHCTGLWCLPVAAVCCRSLLRAILSHPTFFSSLSFILGSTLNKLRVSPAHWRQMPNSGPPSQNWPPVYTRVHTPASATPRGLGCSRDATVIPHAASRQAIRARCTAGTMSSTLQAWSFP